MRWREQEGIEGGRKEQRINVLISTQGLKEAIMTSGQMTQEKFQVYRILLNQSFSFGNCIQIGSFKMI